MRVSTPQIFQQGLDAILRQQSGVLQSQLQIATGKRMQTPADDPAGARRVLDLNETIALTQQFQTNGDAVGTRLALEDSVLDSVTNLLQRVRELAIQGNNAPLTAEDRHSIAAEVEQRLGELLGLANTRDGNDEYLFSGFATRTRPFLADNAGGFVYQGDQGQRRLQIGPSLQMPDGDPGSRIFQAIRNGNGTFASSDNPANTGTGVIDAGSVVDPAAYGADSFTISFPTDTTFEVRDSASVLVQSGNFASGAAIAFNGIEVSIKGVPVAGDVFNVAPSANQDMFTTVQNLVNAFSAPDSDAGGATALHNAVNRALADLDQALESVRETRAGVGARLNAIDSEQTFNADFEVRLQADLSAVENVDLAEAITRLNQQLSGLQAASLSFSQLQNLSLFNFL